MLFLTPDQQSSVEAVKALQYLSNQRQRIVTLNYCALYKTLTYLLSIIADHAEGRSSYPMGEVCVCVCVCVRACVRVCVCVCLCIFMHVWCQLATNLTKFTYKLATYE